MLDKYTANQVGVIFPLYVLCCPLYINSLSLSTLVIQFH